MQMLSLANSNERKTVALADIAAVVGMAALWMSAFKRLLYPALYTYYRTGNEHTISTQAAYAIALVLVAAALFAGHRKLRAVFLERRWPVALLGVAGALGVSLLAFGDYSIASNAALAYAGNVLMAAYLPAHLVFWALYEMHVRQRSAVADVGASFALFAAAYGILELAGAQTMLVSAACPAVSAVMALVCLHAGHVPGQAKTEGSTDDAGGTVATSIPMRAKSEPAPQNSAAHDAANIAAMPPSQHATPKARSESASTVASAPGGSPQAPTPFSRPAHATAGELAPPAPPNRTDAEAHASASVDAAPFEAFGKAHDLSAREVELVAYTYRNYSAKRIAKELFIAESTVYTHQKRIYRKTGVHSKHELIEFIDAWSASG